MAFFGLPASPTGACKSNSSSFEPVLQPSPVLGKGPACGKDATSHVKHAQTGST